MKYILPIICHVDLCFTFVTVIIFNKTLQW